MKNSPKIIISLLILLICSFQQISAETWSCSYLWNGEVRTALFKRSGGVFKDEEGKPYLTLFESEHNIVIGSVFEIGTYIVYLDKNKKKHRNVFLEIVEKSKQVFIGNKELTGSSQGSCNIF